MKTNSSSKPQVAEMTNSYCEALGIEVPSLDAVRGHSRANTYALLLVALLELGGPMTLEEVAGRFERAGIAPRQAALRSLKRAAGRPVLRFTGPLCWSVRTASRSTIATSSLPGWCLNRSRLNRWRAVEAALPRSPGGCPAA